MEKSKAYWAALLLHPAYKKRWIELYLGQQQQNTILCTFKTFYLEKYSDLESRPTELTTIQQPKESQGFLIEDDFYAPQQPSTALSEVDDYFKDLPLPCTDPIAWWAEREIKYPRLSRMAFDILRCPLNRNGFSAVAVWSSHPRDTPSTPRLWKCYFVCSIG